jgi:hypothetical protein
VAETPKRKRNLPRPGWRFGLPVSGDISFIDIEFAELEEEAAAARPGLVPHASPGD